MEDLSFQKKTFEDIKKNLLNNNYEKKPVFNFLNSNDLYNFKNNKIYRNSLTDKKVNNLNSIDGFMITFLLSIKNFKRIHRLRGPTLTYNFLMDKELSLNKKHLFIGLENNELNKLSKKFKLNRKKIFAYNPPYIKEIKFSDKEIKKMVSIIKKNKINYVWIGVGSPKQNVLAKEISKKCNFEAIFNIGAALDFCLEKKKQAPRWIQELGLEWLYRLITDFKYSKKKVWQSFIGTFYGIKIVRLKK